MTSSISIRPPILQASLQPPTHFLQPNHILALKLSRLDFLWHFFIWSVFDVNIQVGMNITLLLIFCLLQNYRVYYPRRLDTIP